MADTKKKPAQKRDPNQPTPKPPKKSKLIPKLLVSAVVVILLTWMGMYSVQVEKGPWDWEGSDWTGFLTFSRQQVEEARKKVEEVDWDAVKDKVTAKTKELWNRVPELEQKLEQKLAQLRGDKQDGETKKSGSAEPVAASAQPSHLQLGCEKLQLAIRSYKKSMNSQAELKKAKQLFQEAQDLLTKAHEEAEKAGDEQGATEIEGYLQQCNVYLEDCSKRETL
ncbi:MAG: hypothetical protein AB7T09_16125 [Planctomycetota bacterium]